jgi:Fe-S-cluster containining protein
MLRRRSLVGRGRWPRIAMALSPVSGVPDPSGADCVGCGRCCHHGPSTVHLLDVDEARFLAVDGGDDLLRRLTVIDDRPPGWRFVRNDGSRCAALDVSVPGRYPCSLYELRPDDCRIVEPGSPACLQARVLGHLGASVEYLRKG